MMDERRAALRDMIHNTKQLFDMQVFRGHNLTTEWKVINQYPWQLLQEAIAPLAAELRALEEAEETS